jgi:hypothetical protein
MTILIDQARSDREESLRMALIVEAGGHKTGREYHPFGGDPNLIQGIV